MDVIEVIKELMSKESTAKTFGVNLNELNVIFRDPKCNAYNKVNAHIAVMNGKYVLMVDLNP